MKSNIIQFPKKRVSDAYMLEKHLDNLLASYSANDIMLMLKLCQAKRKKSLDKNQGLEEHKDTEEVTHE